MVNDLLQPPGGVSPDRVLFDPPPGTATEEHLLRHLHATDRRLVELVGGTLVERTGSFCNAYLSAQVVYHVGVWNDAAGDVGCLTGATGPVRTVGGNVRLPNVALTRWYRLPGERLPSQPVIDFAADLAAELLTRDNTPAEIDRKLTEYFACGCKLAWVIDPDARTARAHTAAEVWTDLTAADALDGGDVLPGFRLPLADLFARLPPAAG